MGLVKVSVCGAVQDQGHADWEAVSKEGSVLGEQKKKKNRRQRYKENKVRCTCCTEQHAC